MKILMADDDQDDRHLSKMAFDRIKMQNDLSFVNDGEELISSLKSWSDLKTDLPESDIAGHQHAEEKWTGGVERNKGK